MHLFTIFLDLSDWFLKNESDTNFLLIKTKLTLICNNDNTVFLKVFIPQYFILFIIFRSYWINLFATSVTSTEKPSN